MFFLNFGSISFGNFVLDKWDCIGFVFMLKLVFIFGYFDGFVFFVCDVDGVFND